MGSSRSQEEPCLPLIFFIFTNVLGSYVFRLRKVILLKILERHQNAKRSSNGYEVADNSEFQLDDDASLLELMVDDMEASGAFYRPTKYWKGYTAAIIELFRKVGLRDYTVGREFATFGFWTK